MSYRPIRLRAPLRDAFKPLLEDRTRVFGGRGAVFAKLMEFVADRRGGYLVVTAPAGFGKTALMANFVGATPEAFAYHFFAPLYGQEPLEAFFLQSVVEQMAEWHGQRRELPDKLDEMRALFQRLIDEAPDKTQVLVLDGIDEVTGWKLAPYLSRTLPDNLHVIATVRDVGQDWRAEYGFPPAQLRHLALDGLDTDGVADVLRAASGACEALARDPAQVRAVMGVAAYPDDPTLGADPFYVRLLAEDIRDGQIKPEDIAKQPPGLDGYLDRWWKEARQAAGDKPVRDLFGTLAAALGPMRRADLETVSPSLVDEWAGDYFDEVLRKVRRLVRLEPDHGYAIAHPRLRRYMADPRRIGSIEAYRERLLRYCDEWPRHLSPYALSYRVSHLIEAGRIDDLGRAFGAEWIAAQWQAFGSFAQLMADFDRAARTTLAQAEPDYPAVVALAVARQTARELMLNFPKELLVAWVRLGELPRVLASLAVLGRTKGRAAEPATAVAAELLAMARRGKVPATGAPYGDLAADLLEGAIEMLPLVRSASSQLEAFQEVAALLAADSGLEDGRRLRLMEAAVAWLRVVSDDCLRATGLGVLASVLARHEPNSPRTAALVEEATVGLAGIGFGPDRLLVAAALAPARERSAPGRGIALARELLAADDGLFEHGSIRKNPLLRLIEIVTPANFADATAAVGLLDSLARRCLDQPDYDYLGAALSEVAVKLCAFGREADAAARIGEAWQRGDDLAGAKAALSAATPLHKAMPAQMEEWLQHARILIGDRRHQFMLNQRMFAVEVARACAETGRWDKAFETLAGVGTEMIVPALDRITELAAAVGADRGFTLRIVDRVTDLAGTLEAKDQARARAVIARTLAEAEPALAHEQAALATGACLAELPEGDTDGLRKLLAMARYTEGDAPGTIAAAIGMRWTGSMASTLAFVGQSAAEAGATSLDEYADALREQLHARAGQPLYSEAVLAAAGLLPTLLRAGSASGPALAEEVVARTVDLDANEMLRCLAKLSAAKAEVDPDLGAEQFGGVARGMLAAMKEGVEISESTAADIYKAVASVAGTLGPKLSAVLEMLESATESITEDAESRLTVDCARALVTAEIDCDRAGAELADCVEAVRGLADERPGALYLRRMFADFTGMLVGPNATQTQAAGSVGRTIANCGRRCPDHARQRMQELLGMILDIESADDRMQAFAHFCEDCGQRPAAFAAAAPAWFTRGLENARALAPPLVAHASHAATQALCRLGLVDEAQRVADGAVDEELRFTLQTAVATARQRLELEPLSDFDLAFTEIDNAALAWSMLHAVKIGGTGDEGLHYMAGLLAEDRIPSERGRLLSEFVPVITAPLRARQGPAGLARLVEAVEAFDRTFVEAARLVAAL